VSARGPDMQLVYRLDIGLQQRIAQRLHLGNWQRLNNQLDLRNQGKRAAKK
jgi:hypothetical protein